MNRIIVATTGASGAIYGVRLLEHLAPLEDWEAHVVVSQSGALTAWQELEIERTEIESLPTPNRDLVYRWGGMTDQAKKRPHRSLHESLIPRVRFMF